MLYIVMVLLGGAFFGVGIIAYRRGQVRYGLASKSWRQSVATIDQSSLERMETSTDDGSAISYRARVAYRYLIGSTEHSGSRPFLCARVNFTRERQGMAWLARVPAGAAVPLWYDPAKPDDSALELNRPSSALFLILAITGVALAAFGIVLSRMG